MIGANPALANVTVTQISSDPFTNTTSQHATEVEPDIVAVGSTLVAAVQQGRFFDGGASDTGFATSTDGGSTWTSGSLPGLTKLFQNGPYDRISDPAIAYDVKQGTWLVSGLAITASSGVVGAAATVNRSTDGGLTWGNAVKVVTASGSFQPGQGMGHLRQHLDERPLRQLLRRVRRQWQRQPDLHGHLHRWRPDLEDRADKFHRAGRPAARAAKQHGNWPGQARGSGPIGRSAC